MKPIRNQTFALCCLLAFNVCCAQNSGPAGLAKPADASHRSEVYRPKNYETGPLLLGGINHWLKKFDLSALDYDEMTVRLAEHASMADHSEGLGPLAVDFLKCLVKKRRFTDPVELQEWYSHDIPLTSDYSAGERLPLRTHYILEVHILTNPRGSRDRLGQPKVVNWYTIFVAYALVKEEKQRTVKP